MAVCVPPLRYVWRDVRAGGLPPSENVHVYETPPDWPMLNANVTRLEFWLGVACGSGPGVSGPAM